MRRPTSRDLAIDLIARTVSNRREDDADDEALIGAGIDPDLIARTRKGRQDFNEMIQEAMDVADLTLEDFYRILKNPKAYILPREVHGTMPA